MNKEELAVLIGEQVKETIEKLGLTQPVRGRAIPGAEDPEPRAPRRIELDRRHWSEYFRVALLGRTRDVPEAVAKALSEGSDSAGGYLVPDDFRTAIIERLPDLSELYPHTQKLATGRDSVKFPRLDTDVAMSWDEGESSAFHESDPAFGQVAFAIHRCNALTKASRELVSDSVFDLAGYLEQLFAEAYAKELDRVIAIGNGTTEPYGIYSAGGIAGVAVNGALTGDRLIEIYHALPKKYRRNARWVMNNQNVQRVRTLKDDANQYLWRPGLEGGQPDLLFGKPIAEQEDLPDSWIGFGDLAYYRIVQREDLGFESTTTGGDAFEKHELWMKCWARLDGRIVLPGAFVKGTGISA